MKHRITLFLSIVLGLCSLYSQSDLIPLRKQDTLLVSDIKTTHLLFEDGIKYVDIGSPYFVADTLQQMVRLKHIGEELTDIRSQLSNLTVITKDGGYYSIVMGFDRFADIVTYKVKKSDYIVEAVVNKKKEEYDNTLMLNSLCARLNEEKPNTRIRGNRLEDLDIKITGLFYIDEKMGIRIALKNKSTIDFDIAHILFRTKLRKRFSKDYLYQERVIPPMYTCTDNMEIKGNDYRTITLLFDKFMLNEKERLAVDIFEEKGGRSVTIDIPRGRLLKPKVI